MKKLIVAGIFSMLFLAISLTGTAEAQGTVIYFEPDCEGTLGDNGWYTSDVTCSWSGALAQLGQVDPTYTIIQGCQDTVIDNDTPGELVLCLVNTTAGEGAGAVTIKRDATPPQITISPDFPLSADEGGSVTVSASADDGPVGSGQVTLAWDLDLDGSFESANPVTLLIPDSVVGQIDPNWVVKAVDSAGKETVQTVHVQVEINNLPAAITEVALRSDQVDLETVGGLPLGGAVWLEASFIDPGVLDTHVAWVQWLEGVLTPSMVFEEDGAGTLMATYTYETPGTYPVKLILVDSEEKVSTATVELTVLSGASTIGQVLIPGAWGLVDEGVLTAGQGGSFVVKLEEGQDKLNGGEPSVAANLINAYRNEFIAVVPDAQITPDWIVSGDLLRVLNASGD